MPDEFINVVINYGQARSETNQMIGAIEALNRTIDRLSAVADAMGTRLAGGLAAARQSISITTNAVTGLSTTTTSSAQKTADGIRLISPETDSMAQRMRLAQQEAQRTAAELNALSEVHQRLRFGDESRLAQYAMRPGTSIYQGQFDLAARLQGVNYGP